MTTLDELWGRFGSAGADAPPDDVRRFASHAILDWFGCAIGGSAEPLSGLLRDEFATGGTSSIIGSELGADRARAALINGAAGHALDFDDTLPAMGGHGTAPVLPAVLAVAEELGATGADVIDAYIVGVEIEARIGRSIGGGHYANGWHNTATMGVFGATAAAARLLGLDAAQFGTGMGIAASNASGVKANFGTMTKPLHAGQAAERGVTAARLAASGFTANAEAIDGSQGLFEAASHADNARPLRDQPGWITPTTIFKYHASCHLTHAGLESTQVLIEEAVQLDEIESLTISVHPANLKVCGIENPTTGLEAKFSLRGTQALLLAGFDTGDTATFTDDPIGQPEVQALLDRVIVATDDGMQSMQSAVNIRTATKEHRHEVNLLRAESDLDRQERRLRPKFGQLAGPIIGVAQADALAERLLSLDGESDLTDLLGATRP